MGIGEQGCNKPWFAAIGKLTLSSSGAINNLQELARQILSLPVENFAIYEHLIISPLY
jgi:hypothetical protein